ncbi:TPA: hypothetical protein HA244_06765 [Candidatus Micrarchaeota archaeon]|nr:hypothetical protein [Candidatus Micrarchaeota archaeon]
MPKILVCFISNNPSNLELSLSAHSQNFTAETRMLIVDTKATHAANEPLAKQHNAIHVAEEEFKENTPDEFKPLFQGAYGGNRNICLYQAFKQGANAVFFDDDTTPAENPLAQYEALFSEGKKIIAGKYLRHAAGTPQLIKYAIDAVVDYADGELESEQAKQKLEGFFAGVPPETEIPLKGVGVAGGNLGVSLYCLEKYCFFPTNYRVEDGTYGVLAKSFTGEEPYNSEDNPAVFHNKTPRENALLENLANEIKGNIIALCVKDSVEEKDSGFKHLAYNIEENSGLVFKAFNLDHLEFKQRQKNILEKASALGFEKQFSALLEIAKATPRPSEEEVKAKAQLFHYAQDNWPKALKERSA